MQLINCSVWWWEPYFGITFIGTSNGTFLKWFMVWPQQLLVRERESHITVTHTNRKLPLVLFATRESNFRYGQVPLLQHSRRRRVSAQRLATWWWPDSQLQPTTQNVLRGPSAVSLVGLLFIFLFRMIRYFCYYEICERIMFLTCSTFKTM